MMASWIAIMSWPFMAVLLAAAARPAVAVAATIIGGYLFLPTITLSDLPLLPPLNKELLASIAAIVTVLATSGRQAGRLSGWLPRSPVVILLFLLLFLGSFGTMITNGDPLFFGPRVLPGLRPYDVAAILLSLGVTLLPFLVARKVFATEEAQRDLVLVLVVTGLIYSVLALYEVRMSPMINRTIYGFFPHDWIQHYRAGGWRPILFLRHGLMVGIFFAVAVLAAATLWRAEAGRPRSKWLFATLWLLGVLFLCKTFGAFLITLLALPIVMFTTPRTQIIAAAVTAGIFLTYPVLRSADLVPLDSVVSFAESVDPQRASSLEFRILHEDRLMEKAKERPVFGWGSWGRPQNYDDEGRNISVTDGAWIIEIGAGGWVRYIGIFGLMTWGIFGQFLGILRAPTRIEAGLAVALAANLVDLIPNTGVSPVTWILAGALVGGLEARRRMRSRDEGREESQEPGHHGRRTAAPALRQTAATRRTTHDLSARKTAPVKNRDGPKRNTGPERRSSLPYARDFGEKKT